MKARPRADRIKDQSICIIVVMYMRSLNMSTLTDLNKGVKF